MSPRDNLILFLLLLYIQNTSLLMLDCLDGQVLHAFDEEVERDLRLARPLPGHLDEQEQALHRQASPGILQQSGCGLELRVGHRIRRLEHQLDPLCVQVGHVLRHVEDGRELHALHDTNQAGRAYDHQLPPLGRLPLKQDEEGLEHDVGEPGANRNVLEQPFDVVQDNHAEGALVCILEHFADVVHFATLRVADHVFRADHLDKRERAVQGQGRGDSRLARANGPLQQQGEQRRLLAALDLVH
mmetsp:Transcript_7316/g.18751  ORF Transcript_7316/g.18751 Transcript_7316/m.18751 type:complete len:243 (-) Transcript_7316:754-1482(-)